MAAFLVRNLSTNVSRDVVRARLIIGGVTNDQLCRRDCMMIGYVGGNITDGTNVCCLFHIE